MANKKFYKYTRALYNLKKSKMGSQRLKKIINNLLLLSLLFSLIQLTSGANATPSFEVTPSPVGDSLSYEFRSMLENSPTDEPITVIVTLREQADLSKVSDFTRTARLQGVIQSLQAVSSRTQAPIYSFLGQYLASGKVANLTPFWIFNGLSLKAVPQVILELAARPEVLSITPDTIDIIPTTSLNYSAPQENIALINAPLLWDQGWEGQGVVIANMDTGVDYTHPDLLAQWRGGANSWYDPYNQHDYPFDYSGHGTWTMGVMVAKDASGSSIGIAPQAQWIAVKIFDDSGSATATGIHSGFQWLLDPDGDPTTNDAPHIVNNSWSFEYPGCNTEFQLDVAALRAVGILPIFAAGNFGPNSSTSVSPGNYPEAFAVGAANNEDVVLGLSSRGPSACSEKSSVYPELTAPGLDINTTDLYGFYTTATGTSLAAPHVAGGLALLLSAYPNVTVEDQEAALVNGAIDLGQAGPDNDYGYGRLDLWGSYQWLAEIGQYPTATPTPSPTDNLALEKPVEVSSIEDDAHLGEMAVDGDLTTSWHTAPQTGGTDPEPEWIIVDLESIHPVGQVIINWEDDEVSAYALSGSANGESWVEIFSTLSRSGTTDVISFNTLEIRFLRVDITGFKSNKGVGIGEFEAYMGEAAPTPSPTMTPTATPTPNPQNHKFYLPILWQD